VLCHLSAAFICHLKIRLQTAKLIGGLRRGEKPHADSPRENASLPENLVSNHDIKNQMRRVYLQ